MKKLELRNIIKEELKKIVKEDLYPVDQFWTIEYNKEDHKLFLLYKGLTVATIKKETMDKICDTWRKIR